MRHGFAGRRLNRTTGHRNALLVNLATGSVIKVPDNFVLSALRQPRPPQSARLVDRLAELCSRNLTEVQLLWKNFLMKKES